MKSLMTFVGILAFNFAPLASASEFSCPVAPVFSNHTCAGTVRVQNLEQLNAYKNTLGVTASKPNVAKGLLIDFSPVLSEDFNISTPCMIKTAPNITITTTGNVCLNGKRKILLDEGFHFSGKNLNLESTEDIVVNKYSVISAEDIKLLSKGSEEINQAFFREGAQITAGNILIETHNVGFIGRNSNLQLTGSLAIHALGDEEASIRQGTVVVTNKIDVNSTGVTKIANLTTLTASEITLIGAQGCEISKGSVMTATDRIGNCFLTSLTKESFSIDKNRGTNPLTVAFSGSTIADAKGFIWEFGDGQTLSTLTPTTNHKYSAVGSFTASLKYATKENYKGLKSAGSVQIDVKAAPIVPTTPPRGYFTYAQDGTFVYLRSFIRRTQFDIATAYYVIDDNQNNKIYMTNYYQNSQSNIEMNTFGQHKITMYVEDTAGQKFNTSMNIWLYDNEENIAPVIRFYGEQSAVRTAFINMYQSFTPHPDENLKEFTVDFGDGHIEHIENAASVTHTYAQAGVYQVKVSAEYNGNVRSQTQPITVTDVNKPILNPIAGFYYFIMDYSGNVVVTDDRSQTPNGKIISYEWDFGNGIISYGQQASHFFSPGNHLVTLTVTDTAGLRSSQTQLIKTEEVGANFVAAFDCWKEGSKTLECEIIALDKDNQISRVKLEWGDGTSQIYTEAEIPAWGLYADEHSYLNYGTYNVKLTIDTTRGQTKTVTHQYAVTAKPPVASIFCYTNNLLVSCNALGSYDPTGSPLTYTFDYGDSFTETNVNGISTHAYSSAGLFTVKLKVTNASGAESTTQTQVQPLLPPNQLPNPVLTCYSNAPHNLRCSSNISQDLDGTIVSYKYSWDDSSSEVHADSSEILHVFTEGGSHQVTLTVTDNDGGVNSVINSFFVQENQAPIASIDCQNSGLQTISCHTFSYDPDGIIAKIQWALDDGFTFNGNVFTHTFAEGDIHSATIVVTDNLGKSATTTQALHVLVNKLPAFDLVVDNINGNLPFVAHFQAANAIDSDGTIVSYKWIFGDGTFSDQEEVDHTFTTAGVYNIKLQVTDNDSGMTEKSVTIRTSAPSNLIIKTDKDNGIANFNVHFDASESTDPDGQIEKYEWLHQGKKFAEGTEADYDFDLAGDQYVELVVTNNFGIETKISKLISVATPPIYLEGIISDVAFVDREYKAIFNLKLDPGIFPENVSFDLQDAPVGVSFDPETKQLTWIPTLENKGDFLFYLNVTDGVLNYRRKFKISVYELEQVASISSTENGGSYTIQSSNSSLDNVEVVLPQNDVPYSLNIFQVKESDQVILTAETSTFLKKPLTLNFENQLNITQRVNQFDHSSSEGLILSPSDIIRTTNKIVVCPQDLIKYKIDRNVREDYFYSVENIGTSKVHVLKSLKNSILVANFLSVLKTLSAQMINSDIYLADDSLGFLKGAGGIHPFADEETIFFNLTSPILMNGPDAIRKYVVLHEYYHLLQSRSTGCIPTAVNVPIGYLNLAEGSADYSAMFSVSSNERKTIITELEYFEYLKEPFKIASFLSKGILHNAETVDDQGAVIDGQFPYRTRLLWDYLDFNDPLIFFKNYGEDYQAPPFFVVKDNDDVLRILKKFNGGDISKSLLYLTDGVNNFGSPFYGKLTSILKDTSIFSGWTSDKANAINKIGLSHITNSYKGFEIDISLPALSGVSRNFLVRDLLTKLPLTNSVDIISIEIPSDPDLKMYVRDIEVSNDGNLVSESNFGKMNFTNPGNVSTADFYKNIHLNQKVIINVVNTGATTKNIKLLVHFLKPNIDIVVDGAIKDSNVSNLFVYQGFANSTNKTTITANDRNDSDNSTLFEFSYKTYCADCENRWVPKTQKDVKSISDFPIRFTTARDNSSYVLTVTATNKHGKSITQSFDVSVPKDQPSKITLVAQQCHPDNCITCLLKSVAYTADFLVSDPDNEYVSVVINSLDGGTGSADTAEFVGEMNFRFRNSGAYAGPVTLTLDSVPSTLFTIPACGP